jgi:hypothetical protein
MFTWNETATSEQIAAFAAELATMPDHIDGIRRYEHGDDLELGPGTADYVLVADFDTVDEYRDYSGHPRHAEFIAAFVEPIAASVSRVQYHVVS